MPRRVALLFPGQGAQHPRMAAGLYDHVDVFTAVMDTAFELLGAEGRIIRGEWLAEDPSPMYDDVTCAQPLLYAIDYALGRTVIEWGVEPAAMLGHSVGEMVAATLAGVLGFADGIRLMRDRMRHYAATPAGGMLAIAAPADDVTPLLTGRLAVAAVNARTQTMVAGTDAELAGLVQALRAKGITCIPARARQAFHSPVVADAAKRTIGAWRRVALHTPHRTVYSARVGARLRPEQATDPVFWAMQPATPVLFWPALEALLRDEDLLLVEAGPGQGLTMLARRHPAVLAGRGDAVPLLPSRSTGPEADRAAVRAAMDRIAEEGHTLSGAGRVHEPNAVA